MIFVRDKSNQTTGFGALAANANTFGGFAQNAPAGQTGFGQLGQQNQQQQQQPSLFSSFGKVYFFALVVFFYII